MYGYIYITTNLVNNKKYIGKHKASEFEGTKYLGSGKALNNAINKYGRDNFTVTLLESCDTEEDLSKREIYWIDYYKAVEDESYYNIIPDSNGGNFFQYLSDQQNLKIFKEHSDMMKTYRHSEAVKQKMSEQRKGHKVSEETKLKISQSNKGKRLGYKESEEVKEKHRIARLNFIQSEETKRKISLSNKGKRSGIPMSDEARLKSSETYKQLKLKWMQNGVNAIRVKESEQQTYLNNGYKFGRKVI